MNKKSGQKRTSKKDNSLSAFSETIKEETEKKEIIKFIQFREPFKCKNKIQKDLLDSIESNDVTVCVGPAGTGKTILTVYQALKLLKTDNKYQSIILVKSITQLKGEDIGILPGDEKMKLKFHMMSFIDGFEKLIGKQNTEMLIALDFIKFEVFGAIRGRSLENSIIIVDEFQNITQDNAKTFLTRFSDNTKVIILGDIGQIDLKNKRDSSLEFLYNKIQETPIDGVNIVEFKESDIVRHRLTSYFLNLFK